MDIPPNINPTTEPEIEQIMRRYQAACVAAADHCEALANELRARIKRQLELEGMDGAGRMSFLVGSDATRVARACVAPLRAAQQDFLNAARSFRTADNRLHVQFFEAIRAARRARRTHDAGGIKVT